MHNFVSNPTDNAHSSKQSHLLGNEQPNIKPLLLTLPPVTIKTYCRAFHLQSILQTLRSRNSFATSHQEATQGM